MYDFTYHRPSSVAEAVQQIAAAKEGRFLAGGMTLLPTMKQRLAAPSDLIDLGRLAELKGISESGGVVTIGAGTKHAEVAGSDLVNRTIPALARLAAGIGDPQVRNRGTLGGSIANNDPAADYPAAVLGLGARVVTNRRTIAADDFFTGLFSTALEADEIILKVEFPVPRRAAYMKFANPASRYAIVGVFVAETNSGVRVAVTGAGQDGVYRATDIEQALSASMSPGALDSITISADGLNGDIHASPEYRAHLIKVMARRAVAAL